MLNSTMKNFKYILGEAEIPSPHFPYAKVVDGKLVLIVNPQDSQPLTRVTLTEWFNGQSWIKLGPAMKGYPGYPCLFVSNSGEMVAKDFIRGPGLYYSLLEETKEVPKSSLMATFKGPLLTKVEYGLKVWEQDMEDGTFMDGDEVNYIQETDVEYQTYMKLLSCSPSQARLLGVEVIEQ